jgi:hypothetical protein
MTIQELLENAQLDALGLLDEQDRDAFDRAFDAAPVPLQAQIRQEQARLCRVDALLPQVDLPDSLWPKVRDAVVLAQQNAAAEALGGSAVLARAAGQPVGHAAGRDARPLPMTRATGVHRAWRAATIGLATAAVVLGGVLVHVRTTADEQIRSASEGLLAQKTVDTFGAEYLNGQLFSKETLRYVMNAESAVRGEASVFTNPTWKTAMLYCQTPAAEGHTLRLVELDDAGNIVRQFDEFESKGSLAIRAVNLEGSEPRQLALVSAPRGQAASKGQILLRVA